MMYSVLFQSKSVDWILAHPSLEETAPVRPRAVGIHPNAYKEHQLRIESIMTDVLVRLGRRHGELKASMVEPQRR